MIKVYVGTNTSRNELVIPATTSLRAALEQAGVNYSEGMATIDGSPLRPGDMDKSFAELGITSKCFLVIAAKHDNA